MARRISFGSLEEATENYEGYCTQCQAFTRGECEPDAREYLCPDCGGKTVYGAEEAMFMGLLTVDMEEDDFGDDDSCAGDTLDL